MRRSRRHRTGSGWNGRRFRARRRRRRGRDPALLGLTFEVAQMTFECRAKVAGVALEFRQHLSEVPGQVGQLFRPENDQGDNENDDQVRDAKHAGSTASRSGGRF